MALARGTKNLVNQAVAVNAGVAGTDSVNATIVTNIIDQSSISSVPQRTKNTHWFQGAIGTQAAALTVFASIDQVNWFTKPEWQTNVLANANGALAMIETDGIYPFFSHQVGALTGAPLIQSFIT